MSGLRVRVFKLSPSRWCMQVRQHGHVTGAAFHPTWQLAMRHAGLILRPPWAVASTVDHVGKEWS